MSAVDCSILDKWYNVDSTFKSHLLRLSKTKLIKECKLKKIEYSGNKNDIINRLFKLQIYITEKEINDVCHSALPILRRRQINNIALKILNNPQEISKLSKNQSFIKTLAKLSATGNSNKVQLNLRNAAALCFNIIFKIDYIINNKKENKLLINQHYNILTKNESGKKALKSSAINITNIIKNKLNI
eukprot:465346_1